MNKFAPKLAIILLISFIMSGVFGFFALNPMEHEHGNGNCVASVLSGDCPIESSLGVFDFHLSVFKHFSLAIILLAAFAVIIFRHLEFKFVPKIIERTRERFREKFEDSGQKFSRWLVIRERVDSAVIG